MGLLLAIETSSRLGSLALLRTDEQLRTGDQPSDDELLGHMLLDAERRPDECLLSAIEALLGAHRYRVTDLTAIAFGAGPGSFTGVRLAAAAAHGIGWGMRIPVLGVNSIEALAVGVARQFQGVAVAVAVDARMGQVYWLWHDGDEDLALPGERGTVFNAVQCGQLALPQREFIAAGDGWQGSVVPAAWRVLAAQTVASAVPQATDVAALAQFAWRAGARPPAGEAQPRYLRGADAWGSG